MTVCTCTCKMCVLYGHRPELVHCEGCPERKPKSGKPVPLTGVFPMHEAGGNKC